MSRFPMRRCLIGLVLAAASLHVLPQTVVRAPSPLLAPLAAAGDASQPPRPWHVVGLPAQRKPYTRFSVVALDGERVLRVEATESYGNLVHHTHVDDGGAHVLSWRWRVDEPLPEADLRRRSGDDMPLRVCALFDLPLRAIPFLDRQLLRAVRLGVADDPPGATVCYVWDSHLPPGTTVISPFTRRIRSIVVHGPETPLHAWRQERRDVTADFLRLFGDESRTVPPLVGIAIGADADNTHGHSVAHVADVVLH